MRVFCLCTKIRFLSVLILSMGRCALISKNSGVKKVGKLRVPVGHRCWWRRSPSSFYTIFLCQSLLCSFGK